MWVMQLDLLQEGEKIKQPLVINYTNTVYIFIVKNGKLHFRISISPSLFFRHTEL